MIMAFIMIQTKDTRCGEVKISLNKIISSIKPSQHSHPGITKVSQSISFVPKKLIPVHFKTIIEEAVIKHIKRRNKSVILGNIRHHDIRNSQLRENISDI